REIHAADESQTIVDDHHFLVMRAAGRMYAVHAEVQPAMRAPIKFVNRQPLAVERIEHREVPRKDVGMRTAVPGHDGIEELAQRLRHVVRFAVAHELHPAVDVPADHEQVALRARRHRAERAKVRGRVDQKRDAARARDAPAVVAGLENGVSGHEARASAPARQRIATVGLGLLTRTRACARSTAGTSAASGSRPWMAQSRASNSAPPLTSTASTFEWASGERKWAATAW